MHTRMPDEIESRITKFERLLLFKAFREEKLSFLIKDFVRDTLGPKFSESLAVSMDDVYADSDYKTPVIFVLTAGAEPTGSLLRFVKKMKGENLEENITIISLG